MGSLFKPHKYTLPDGSTRTPDGTRVNSKTPGVIKQPGSPCWYGKYKDRHGIFRRVKLLPSKHHSAERLKYLERKVFDEIHGITLTETHDNRQKPLVDHLADFEAVLAAEGNTTKQVRQTAERVRKVITGCGFARTGDLSLSRVQTFLAKFKNEKAAAVALDPGKEQYTREELAQVLGIKPRCVAVFVRRHRLEALPLGPGKPLLYPRATVEVLVAGRAQGRSVQTMNHYRKAVKQFCTWLVTDGRMVKNPLAHLKCKNVAADRRHDRRPLSAAELVQVLDTALASASDFRGLSGMDRHALYLVACVTGFRKEELAALTPVAFNLPAGLVTLGAAFTKNKKTAVQPIPADVAEALATYLAGRPAEQPVWPGTWGERAALMFRLDVEAAGLPYVIDGPDGPLYADFHALRHSFVALLDKSGVSVKQAMQLARHSDPRLTMARYGRAQLKDLAAAVDRLPSLLPGNRDHRNQGPAPLADQGVTKTSPPEQRQPAPLRFARAVGPRSAREGKALADRELSDGSEDDGGQSEVHPAGFEPATFGSVVGPKNLRQAQAILRSRGDSQQAADHSQTNSTGSETPLAAHFNLTIPGLPAFVSDEELAARKAIVDLLGSAGLPDHLQAAIRALITGA